MNAYFMIFNTTFGQSVVTVHFVIDELSINTTATKSLNLKAFN